ncbi:heterokaryon incompatibility protein-domain-containing protein [Echria macrotheca]|uniref:Heterokaryon incompatibility protein-domain-containing protein n=1 Tax=Echria macrotheca TaxID=438768 RepID=A0AAJ0BIP4_9PEZI|nr:heterokaryon incompatibility protein-domain-containing protein [Echria macrotheca]
MVCGPTSSPDEGCPCLVRLWCETSPSPHAQPDRSDFVTARLFVTVPNKSVLPRAERSTMSPAAYEYQLLPRDQSIRVIELLPGEPDAEIVCFLHHTDLEDAEDTYDAISYVWGDPNDRIEIKCDGGSMHITANLASALLALRSRDTSRRLWADAICINQSDILEKNHQVRHMGNVYEIARKVIVWLGPDINKVAQPCFDVIQQMNRYLGSLLPKDFNDLTRVPFINLPSHFSKSSISSLLANLLLLPWFKRVWVVQEVAVAKVCDLVWGEHELGMEQLAEVLLWLWSRPELSSLLRFTGSPLPLSVMTYVNFVRYGYQTYAKGHNRTWIYACGLRLTRLFNYYSGRSDIQWLPSVLSLGRGLCATIPADHVYAFLGNPLARYRSNGGLMIEPDYAKTTEEVFIELAHALAKDGGQGAEIMRYVAHVSESDIEGDKYPSWVPRWNSGGEHVLVPPVSWYRAAPMEEISWARVEDGNSLVLPGIVFDDLEWVSGMPWPGSDNLLEEHFLDELWGATQRNFATPSQVLLGKDRWKFWQPLEDAFCLTLIGGSERRTGEYVANTRRNFYACRQHLHHQRITASGRSHSGPSASYSQHNAINYLMDLDVFLGLSLSTTRCRRLVLATPLAKKGDVCCIVRGSRVPYILRPTRQTGKYKLVGVAYIHGIMEGELVDGRASDPKFWQEITIL